MNLARAPFSATNAVLALLALLWGPLPSAADMLPRGHKYVKHAVEVHGTAAYPDHVFFLFPVGTQSRGLDRLGLNHAGVLSFSFYAASPPRLYAVPKGRLGAIEAALGAHETRCHRDCDDDAGCIQKCGPRLQDLLSAPGIARSPRRLIQVESVPKDEATEEVLSRYTLKSMSGDQLNLGHELVPMTAAQKRAAQEARASAELLLAVQHHVDRTLRDAPRWPPIWIAFLAGVALFFRWRARRRKEF